MDAHEKTRLEIENGFRQYDLGLDMIRYYLDPDRPFALRPGMIQDLQRVAVDGIEDRPGQWRTTPVGIEQSKHIPPEAHLVPNLVLEMCDYVNENLHERTPFHLSAYVMWRHNWIHPFSDGNGRTSRVLSYIILCILLGYELPGSPSIPQQIQEDRTIYFRALEDGDEAYRNDKIDVSAMEIAVKNMLAKQLLSVIEDAGGSV